MSEVVQRRWAVFKQSKRSYYALLIFGTFFLISLCAEIVANDKPILIYNDGDFYFPAIAEYNESDFGSPFEFPINYHDVYFQEELLDEDAIIIWPPIPYSFDTITPFESYFPAAPSVKHWLGTDDQGRDILARVIYGFRISMLFGLILALFNSIIGILVGLSMGYFGGKFDLFGQRFMEIWGSVPTLYLIIILSGFMTMNFWLLLGINLLFSWMMMVGIVRMESFRVRNMDFVRSARALGVSNRNIMLNHVLPNALVAVVAMLPFSINGSIAALSSLDFLGFGLPASYPSLGEIISQGKNNLYAPWIAFSGFLTLAGMLTGLVFIGEGVRDAFDPKTFLQHSSEGEE